MKYRKKHLYWFLLPLLILACAKQTAPTGGPKDTIPPILNSSNPKKGETNVNTRNLELLFTEAIVLNNPKDQIMITPDLGKKYDIVAKKKKVTINLENDLAPNTTYSFNFRDAIQDITEKNPANNLKLAFSTGTYIDSLTINGSVSDLLKNNETKDATIALYESDTFNIFKHKPSYITKSNDKGLFEFENLKNGEFYIYTFEDKNKNLIVDSKSESYGFLKDPINLTTNQRGIDIQTIRMDTRPLKLSSARPYNTYFNLRLTKGVKDFKFSSETRDTILSRFGEDRANIRIYNTFQDLDSIPLKFVALDSINNIIDTTIHVKFQTRQTTPEKFSVTIDQITAIKRTAVLTAKGRFTKPITLVNHDSIKFFIDSLNIVNFSKDDISIDNQTGTLQITKQLPRTAFQDPPKSDKETNPNRATKEKQNTTKGTDFNNLLYFGKAAFQSVELDSSAHFEQKIRPITIEDSGVIIVHVTTKEPNYIIQLLNKNFEVIRSVQNKSKITFEDLTPTDYQIRIIIDTNNDGTWSPGNFFKKEEPEKILYYVNEKKIRNLTLKPNWELGPLLITF